MTDLVFRNPAGVARPTRQVRLFAVRQDWSGSARMEPLGTGIVPRLGGLRPVAWNMLTDDKSLGISAVPAFRQARRRASITPRRPRMCALLRPADTFISTVSPRAMLKGGRIAARHAPVATLRPARRYPIRRVSRTRIIWRAARESRGSQPVAGATGYRYEISPVTTARLGCRASDDQRPRRRDQGACPAPSPRMPKNKASQVRSIRFTSPLLRLPRPTA